MATTIKGKQVRDGSVAEVDIASAAITRDKLHTTTAGKAVVAKIIQGPGTSVTSTGADAGTGDVTIGVSESTINAALDGFRYYIKAVISGNYAVSNLNQLEAIVFDSLIHTFDQSSNRYDLGSLELAVNTNEVWNFDINALVDSTSPWSLVLYDKTNGEVIHSAYVIPVNRFNQLSISTTFVSTGAIKVSAYVYCTGAAKIVHEDSNGLSPCTTISFNRIK